jgi:hypothetical protein
MSGLEIQSEVAAALAEAGEAVGTGPYLCTIRRASAEPDEPQTPWDEPASPANDPVDYEVTGLKEATTSRYMDGTLIGERRRVLTIGGTGVRPLKSDKVALGVAKADVTGDTVFEEIIEIETEEPTDTPLLYGLHLAI